MSRRLFLKILIALGLGNFFPKLAEAQRLDELHTPQDGYKPLTNVKFLRQIVTKDSRTSRMLMWQIDSQENFSVEYKLVGENSAQFATVEQRDLICSCALENLKPESLYKFRIISDERATSWQDLRTAGDGQFRMIIFADSQCEHYDVWQRTADTADENFPDAELVTIIGDLVDNGQADYQWRAWHLAATKIFSGRIFAPVMGNHECYGVDWFNALPTGYLNQFTLPDNGAKNLDGYFYSFDYGAAHFFVLNTQFAELDKFKPKLRDAQEYFLRRDAANVNRPWKIVFMHKDIYDYAQDKFSDIADAFTDLFDELEIDLVFTGHLHTYRNRGKIFARQKNLNGTTYILCGRAGDQKYVEPPSDMDDVTYPNLREEPESFIVLDVDANEINLTAQTVDGEIIDSFTLTKGTLT
ncbi:MAG: metallophosphoesterase family protein [Selenomonadaceae bacterium]|nr:metallophosphoesterase family protein [Selenomonadaceae bacterium]